MQVNRSFMVALAAALLCAPAVPRAQPKQEREAASPPGQLSEVGKGQRMGRQELKPGAYITPRHRKAVQAWLAQNQGAGKPCLAGFVQRGQRCVSQAAGRGWQIGTALPQDAPVAALPGGLQSALPPAPPGNQYVLLSGDILLIASASRIVLDAVPANK